MKMKNNVKQQQKSTRRLVLITGVCSILGIAIIWFVFYTLSGTEESVAGKKEQTNSRAYIENENLTDFEVQEARIRPADDPVVTGSAKYKQAQNLSNE
jgi:hypothetical protein